MENLRTLLELLNETFASAIVIVAASLSLYNVTRNLQNRVARTSAVVLFCVTAVYTSDVLLGLEPGVGTFEALLRFQWVGLAFLPAGMFHLSDALLATTGLPSRGRRTRMVRFLYGISTVFLLIASFTDWLIAPEVVDNRVSLRAAPIFLLYLAYYLIVNAVALINVQRARRRCLTRRTEHRMAYLQFAMVMPILGVFPYSVFLNPGGVYTINALMMVNIANLGVILMLLFLSFPLSFFGSQKPDRVVKADLMRFMLLGPGTGMIALIVIIYTGPATELFGVAGVQFMPFAVVAMILLWQWVVDLSLPWLEKRLIYNDDDDEQIKQLKSLSDRLLTPSDHMQLVEAILDGACDYLQVENGFILRINGDQPETVSKIGSHDFDIDQIYDEWMGANHNGVGHDSVVRQDGIWICPLYSRRSADARLIGMMGIESRGDDLMPDEEEVLNGFVRQAARTLDNMQLQNEVYAALEGLIPQITVTRRADNVEYKVGRTPATAPRFNRDEIIEQVQAALRHYWGGPGLTESRLLELNVVRQALEDSEDNPARALRAVLTEAIENQKPEGEQDMRSPEWMVYNILKLRFIDKRKVRETARRLYISDANLYRKQNIAIESVADAILKMEQMQYDDQPGLMQKSSSTV